MTATDPLLELLAACTVPVERDGQFHGTGFWVAPGELLTCAHVVHGGRPLTVDGVPAEPVSALLAPDDSAARFYPQPDAALLRVLDAPVGHPCVRLDAATPAIGSDLLQLAAWTAGENAPGRVVRSGASLHLETLFTQDGVTLYKLREGQVIGGYSGGPLLNRRTGGVCALVDSSRNVKADLGGFGVPVALIAEHLGGLLGRNAAFHTTDRRWVDAVEAQRVADIGRREQDRGPAPSSSGQRDVRVGRPPMPADAYQERRSVREEILRLGTRNAFDGSVDTVVLCANGGMGKTQIAAQVWNSTRDGGGRTPFLAVWVSASTRSSVQAGYAAAALTLDIGSVADEKAAADSFLAWLAATDRTWLVVLDGLADPRDLVKLWPFTSNPALAGGGARVLVTTRRQDESLFEHGRRRVDVPLFTSAESVRYLRQRLTHPRRLPDPRELSDAGALAAEVHHLPLALSQASAYILSRRTTVERYRVLLASTREELDKIMPANYGDDHERTVQETWELSIEQADSLPPIGAATRIARLIAVLDPDGVPEEVLTATPARSRPGGVDLIVDEARQAIFNLHDVGIVSHDADGRHPVVRMHALAQRATRERAGEAELGDAVSSAADALVEAWPQNDFDLDLTQRFRACAAGLLRNPHPRLWQQGAHPLHWRLIGSLGTGGVLSTAVDLSSATVAASVDLLGPEHRDTLTARHVLAYWQGVSGDPRGAARSFESLYRDRLRILGSDDPDTLSALSRMALWRGQAGDAQSAVALFEELVAGRTRVLGPDDPDTLGARHDLAYWRGGAGYPHLAVSALADLLEDRLRILGADHPDTHSNQSALALWRGEAGDAAQAAADFRAFLPVWTTFLGPRHPKILSTRFNVARWTGEAGDPASAVEQFEGLVADSVDILGRVHPQTLDTRRELACWHGENGDPARAARELAAVLADDLGTFGPDHPRTLATRNNLASWTGEAGDPAAAVAMLVALTTDAVRVFTDDHPDTLEIVTNLAHWRGHAGDHTAAITAFQRLLETYSARLPDNHPKILEVKSHIAWWSGESGEPREAAEAFRDIAESYRSTLGPQHPRTVQAERNAAHWSDG